MQSLRYFKLNLLFMSILLVVKSSSISTDSQNKKVPQILHNGQCEFGYFEIMFPINNCCYTDKSYNNAIMAVTNHLTNGEHVFMHT